MGRFTCWFRGSSAVAVSPDRWHPVPPMGLLYKNQAQIGGKLQKHFGNFSHFFPPRFVPKIKNPYKSTA